MELRIAAARATKDIDLTYIRRVRDPKKLLNQMILNDLQTLGQIDLNDHFTYQVGASQIDLTNAPYGGARYPVVSLIDGKTFVKFQLDVDADFILDQTETIQTKDWLEFCGITAPIISMISIEQQFAEKLHAYTLPRNDRINSRVKDLIDLMLLPGIRPPRIEVLHQMVNQVFKKRDTHPLPQELEPPPTEWETPFMALAAECNTSA